MKLRDYQQKAVDAVLACWLKFKTCVVVLPTGCGKTVVFGEVVRRVLEMDKGGQPVRAMILATASRLTLRVRVIRRGLLTGARGVRSQE